MLCLSSVKGVSLESPLLKSLQDTKEYLHSEKIRAPIKIKSALPPPPKTPPKIKKAQSTRTAKFDPRTLSRKRSRKWPRECTRRCPRKCPRRLRLVLCKTHQRIPTKTPTTVLTGNFLVLTPKNPFQVKNNLKSYFYFSRLSQFFQTKFCLEK